MCRVVVGVLEIKRKGREFGVDFGGGREVVMVGKVFWKK